jgi:hypothetical protein
MTRFLRKIYSKDFSRPSPKGPMAIYLDVCVIKQEEYPDVLMTVGHKN